MTRTDMAERTRKGTDTAEGTRRKPAGQSKGWKEEQINNNNPKEMNPKKKKE